MTFLKKEVDQYNLMKSNKKSTLSCSQFDWQETIYIYLVVHMLTFLKKLIDHSELYVNFKH